MTKSIIKDFHCDCGKVCGQNLRVDLLPGVVLLEMDVQGSMRLKRDNVLALRDLLDKWLQEHSE